VIESGSRVLHLSSDIFSKDCLYLEDKIGVCMELKIENMYNYFTKFSIGSQFKSKRLPVSCVVLAIPDSRNIGYKFFELGVSHVIAFDLVKNDDQIEEIENQLMPIRFNYIYAFVQ
jgi:hypothetical protein